MRDLRQVLSTTGVIAALGSAVVFGSLALSRCAGAQDTTRSARGGYTVLLASAPAPAALSALVTIDADSVPLGTLLQDIARRAKVGIVYDRMLPGLTERVSLHIANVSASSAVLRALDGAPIDALVGPSGQIVLVRHAARPGQVRGIVLDSAGGPVPNAFIEFGTTPLVAVSTGDGSFAFSQVAPGDYSLRVRRLGYHPSTRTVRVTDGDLTVTPTVVTLEPTPIPLTAVVVSPGYFGIMAQQVGSPQTLNREQIRTRPQLGDDLFRSINRLPGLSSDDFSAGFHVRGSEMDQMYVTFDGVQLIEPFHLKDLDGALSILDVRSVNGIDLTTGGFTSEYGGRLGSLLAIRSVEPDPGTIRTTLGASITNLRVQSEGGFAGGRGSWVVAARRGYVDLALKLAGISDSISPVYSDVFAKASWTFSDRNRVAVHVLEADDGLHYTDSNGNGDGGTIRSAYGSRYAWLTWDTQPTARLTGQSVLSASGLTWSRLGVVSERLNEDMHDRRTFRDFAAREDWAFSLADRAAVKFGGEAHALRASYDYVGIHRTSSVAGGAVVQNTDSVSAELAPAGSDLGAYVAPRVALTSWLTAETGVRIDRTSYTHEALLSPRANVVANVSPSTSVRASFGRYDQAQPIYSLQVGDGVKAFAAATVSDQKALSVEQRIGNGVSVRVEAYDRRMVREQATYINLRAARTEVFQEFGSDRVLLPASSGRAHGLEFMARRQVTDGLEWTASYAIASVTDNVNGLELPRMYDQRHTAYLDASYHPGSSWWFSAAWQVHSGWPQPPISFSIDTLRGGQTPTINVTPIYGPLSAIGAQRLPWYHRLDLRYTRDIVTSHGRLSLFADVFNVFNTPNARYDDYSYSLRNGQLVVTPVRNTQVGRLPSAGISWDF